MHDQGLFDDLRERVVTAVAAGDSCRSVAARFGVSVSSVVRWLQRWRASGSVAPDKMGGYRPVLLELHRDFILEQVRQSSHVTARGLQRLLAGRRVKVSHDSVWRFLRREGLSFKKSLFAIEQARADIAQRRHVGLDPGLIDKDQPGGIKIGHEAFPAPPPSEFVHHPK